MGTGNDDNDLLDITITSTPPAPLVNRGDGEDRVSSSLSEDSWCRNILAFIFLFYNMTLNLFVLAVVHERVPTQIHQPLPDLAFDALPKADWALDVAEYIIIAQVSGVLFLMFIHRYRVIIFRRLCVIMGILYLFRAICMISTVLPRANLNYYCSPQLFNSSDPDSHRVSTMEYTKIIFSRVFHMLVGFGLSINGKHNYCGDYLYSGHTVSLTVTYLFLREYLMPSRCRTLSWKFFQLTLFTGSCVAILAILISRGHYLVDILMAYYVTTRVFWIYHSMAYNYALRVSSPTNYLSRVWWYYLFRYFESIPDDGHRLCDSPTSGGGNHHHHHHHAHHSVCDACLHKLPRVFEWPLPWPRWLRRRTNRQRLLPTPPA